MIDGKVQRCFENSAVHLKLIRVFQVTFRALHQGAKVARLAAGPVPTLIEKIIWAQNYATRKFLQSGRFGKVTYPLYASLIG